MGSSSETGGAVDTDEVDVAVEESSLDSDRGSADGPREGPGTASSNGEMLHIVDASTPVDSSTSRDGKMAPDASAPVTYGEAMTGASIREVGRLCGQASRQFNGGDHVQAASSLELAKGMLLPALGWLMHVSGIVLEESEDDDEGGGGSENSSEDDEDDDFPGFYL